MIRGLVFGVVIAPSYDHRSQVLADFAGRFALFRCPEVRLSPVTTAEGPPAAIVNMPGGRSLRVCPFGNCITKLHKRLSFTKLYAFILPKFNNAL